MVLMATVDELKRNCLSVISKDDGLEIIILASPQTKNFRIVSCTSLIDL